MRKRNKLLLCGYLLYLVMLLMTSNFVLGGQSSWFSSEYAFVLLASFVSYCPFVTGIFALVDFGTSFLPSMKYNNVWRGLFGGLGVSVLTVYFLYFAEIVAFEVVAALALMVAIWICWIVRWVLHCRRPRREQATSIT